MQNSSKMRRLACLRMLWRDDSGATAIEYGLIAALVAVVVVTALSATGTKLKSTFNTVATEI